MTRQRKEDSRPGLCYTDIQPSSLSLAARPPACLRACLGESRAADNAARRGSGVGYGHYSLAHTLSLPPSLHPSLPPSTMRTLDARVVHSVLHQGEGRGDKGLWDKVLGTEKGGIRVRAQPLPTLFLYRLSTIFYICVGKKVKPSPLYKHYCKTVSFVLNCKIFKVEHSKACIQFLE